MRTCLCRIPAPVPASSSGCADPSRRCASPLLAVVCLYAFVASPVPGAAEGESLILTLEEAIGVSAPRESAASRAPGGAQSRSLARTTRRPGSFPIKRKLDPADVLFDSIQVRSARARWIGALIAEPRGAAALPAVFLLDDEVREIRLPTEIPEGADSDEFDGSHYIRTPIGSHLLGAGNAVAFVNADTLKRQRAGRIAISEWTAVLEAFRSRRGIDPESVFIFATREHTELALRLAARVPVAGVIMEEPSSMMFVPPSEAAGELRTKTPAAARVRPDETGGEAPDRAAFTREIAEVTFAHLKALKGPLLVLMARDVPWAKFNRQTLLPLLAAAKVDFRVVLLDKPVRAKSQRPSGGSLSATPMVRGEADEEQRLSANVFDYDEEGMELMIARSLQYMAARSKVMPVALPEFDPARLQLPEKHWPDEEEQALGEEGME